ncbi:HpcH/HpaI aldolase/citrate lyase family protein [Streptomyces sp. INA 01156]
MFTQESPARLLSTALGATLYSPATRPRLADDVVKQAGRGVVSMVLCLEDSIGDEDVIAGEANLVRQFADLAARPEADLPLLFVRSGPRPDTGPRPASRPRPPVAVRIRPAEVHRGTRRALPGGSRPRRGQSGHRLFAMPVLESPELLYRETRVETLEGILRAVDKYRDRVLALRLGVTDFCSPYGLRRGPDMTAYDIQIVASVIADVVNMLARADGTGFTVTGPVWEYFRSRNACSSHNCGRAPSWRYRPWNCARH